MVVMGCNMTIRAWLLMMVALMMGCVSGPAVKEVVVAKDVGALVKTPVRASSAVYQHSLDSTVALMVRDEDDGSVHIICSGVWVSATEIVTAAHCIARDEGLFSTPLGSDVMYIVQNETRGLGKEPAALHMAEVKYFNRGKDIAVLKALSAGLPHHAVANLPDTLPGIGEVVHVVGHPKGLYWTFTDGILSAYRETSLIGPVVQVNGFIWFGNSGGGVFDTSGNLVGICSMLTRVPNISYFVHLDTVKEALGKVRAVQ